MKQLEKVVRKTPNIIAFVGPLDTVREGFLSMQNDDTILMAFKVKESKNVTVYPHYDFIAPRAELFIKLKAKSMKHLFDNDYITVILAYPPHLTKLPKDPKDFWHRTTKPHLTLQRRIHVGHVVPKVAQMVTGDDDDGTKMKQDDDEVEEDEKDKNPADKKN